MRMTRRIFLKHSGIAMVGMAALPGFLRRAVASTERSGRRTLVVLFQRGAVDGLNVVVPYGEEHYYRLRPTIAIPRPSGSSAEGVLDLDGFFGLHPALAPLVPLYRQGTLAIVHATGSPDTTRSHFDAQDAMESGVPGVRSTTDGWLNRALQQEPVPKPSPLRAVALSPRLPLTLRGAAPAVAVADLRQFRVVGPQQLVEENFEAMYAETLDQFLRGVGDETFEAVDLLKKLDPQDYRPDNGAQYPASRFGQSLREIAQLIKADVGLEVAFVDSGGWDHHVNEGAVEGRLANLLRDLGQGLAAFATDLGDRLSDVVFVSMSEFGRTAHENGNRGTDHGHGNCMLVLGGPVRGGRVYGRWPGLAPEQLNDQRDLKVTTDYRTILAEILTRHLAVQNLEPVFPAFEQKQPRDFLNLLRR